MDITSLYAEQISIRVGITRLYSQLLTSIIVPNTKIVCAAHEWSITNIRSLTTDLLTGSSLNPYSFAFQPVSKDNALVLEELDAMLKQHKQVSNRIEQFGKGVVV